MANKRFEVDKVILGKTTFCDYKFECLDFDYPKSGEAMTGIESVLCRFENIDYCPYEQEIVKKSPVCICHVRNEIHRKYKNKI